MQNVRKYAFLLVFFLPFMAPSLTRAQGLAGLSQGDVGNALKQALNSGVQKGTTQLSAVNGFFGDAAIKILMPPEAAQVESTLRKAGAGAQVDQLILDMNRGAEDATKSAATIFLNAITQMSIGDAINILKGGDTSATHYLRVSTTVSLTVALKPIITSSLQKVNATQAWSTVMGIYDKIPFHKKVNTDLVAYVTGKALDGIFYEIALQEKAIRANPAASATALMQKVFGSVKL